MALSADRTLRHEEKGRVNTGTLAGTLYKGSIVSTDVSGTFVASTNDATVGTCMGIATAGGVSGGTVSCIYDCWVELPIHSTDITAADIGDNCFAYDDEYVTTTTSLGPVVGQIMQISRSGYVYVWVGHYATPHSTT
jgi:hypothetical protein